MPIATTIDAHQHFLPVFQPAVLAPELERAGVAGTVLIQSVDTAEENVRLLEYAAEAAFVRGVVAWLPLSDPEAAYAELERLPTPPVVGVRCLIGRSSADWLVSTDVLDVFHELATRGLAWDVVAVTERQVSHVCHVAAAVPGLRIVVDHLARPPVESAGWEPWAGWVQRLAAHPNIALKVSIGIDALTAWARWNPKPLAAYVNWAESCFGSDRLLLASNWPVVLLRRTYLEAWEDLTNALRRAGLDDAALADARGGTARRWYRLAAPAFATRE
ncbi:amidohydrolase family protein [Flindersiella endophytica]